MRIPKESLGTVTDWRDGITWTGDDLNAQANRTAHRLVQAGIGRGDRVVVWHGGSGRFFGDLLGIWKIGAGAVCLNPSTTEEELRRIVDFVGASVVLDDGVTRLASDITATVLDSGSFEDAGETHRAESFLDDDALILFTSGTTGTPKGVVHTFRSLLARVTLNQLHIPRELRTQTLSVLPTHFGHGLIGNCLTPLLDRQTLLLAPANNLDVTGNLGAIVDDHEITFMSSVPTLWKRVLGSVDRPAKGTLQRVNVGSAPLSAELWHGIAEWAGTQDVFNMYGITETANWIAGATLADGDISDGLVGTMWGGSAAVMDSDGDIHATGEGELLIQSPSTMKGYFELPEQTNTVLRNGWFHTGDIGQIDAAGTIRLTGRQKYEINRGGIKVHPEDIDLLLERHESIGEACAFALPDEVEGEIVAVAVTASGDVELKARALQAWCAQRLAREKIPSRWFVVDEIPKTDRGKVNRDNVAAFCMALDS
jgi:acyl-CoA synthetase (AMP-forming)/AMP-acid ligase II